MKLGKLELIAEKARKEKQLKFTSLAHHINVPLLKICFKELDGNKACGSDGVTKEDYGENLEGNLENLVEHMKNKTYFPKPVKRVEIPKPGKKDKRVLSIFCVEDKLVQMAVKKILEPIYEPIFLDSSYGYRPKRSCHMATRALNYQIMKTKTNYVAEVDIKGFFDHIEHNWMRRCLEERVSDPNFLRLVDRLLKTRIWKDNQSIANPKGTPQGSLISPLLANIYLHYVVDLWFERDFKRRCKGHCEQIRYCDDFVVCFDNHEEAKQYLQELQIRLSKFGLEIAPDKTRIVKFGRKAWHESKRTQEKPSSFEFLGFTHYLGVSRKGFFKYALKTSKKKIKQGLKNIKIWLKKVIHREPKKLWWPKLILRLQGHFNYFGVSGNYESLKKFLYESIRITFKLLNRRSQKRSMNWEQFLEYLKWYPLPTPRIIHNLFLFHPPSSGRFL